MAKTVLHELLAVEQGLSETSNLATKNVLKVLPSKAVFSGMNKSHTIFNDADQHLVQATQINEVQSTVDEQLNYLSTQLANHWDVSLQKEEANQRARGDIYFNGEILAPNVPSIVLLGLEKKLTALIAIYNALPTLDAATAWEAAPEYSKPGVFRTKHNTERQHSITTKEFQEVSPATQFHKAQLAEVETTKVIGKYIISEFSGSISSFEKSAKLERLTQLIREVKKARQRANNAEVNTELKIGKVLLDCING